MYFHSRSCVRKKGHTKKLFLLTIGAIPHCFTLSSSRFGGVQWPSCDFSTYTLLLERHHFPGYPYIESATAFANTYVYSMKCSFTLCGRDTSSNKTMVLHNSPKNGSAVNRQLEVKKRLQRVGHWGIVAGHSLLYQCCWCSIVGQTV